jgi:putative isomerase
MPTIPLVRAWNTWSSLPAEAVFLPLGVRLTPLAYAASSGRATLFPSGPGVRLGRHGLDAGTVELELNHAGTRLDWHWQKPDPFTLVGGWRALQLGEWGLRFWICLCLSADGGETVRLDEASGAAVVQVGHRFVAMAMEKPPSVVAGYDSIGALTEEYERHGYWYLATRAGQAKLLALRCNLEMHQENRFAAAVADRADLAIARAQALLASKQPAPGMPTQTGEFAGALDAVRDVVGWNTVWDTVNHRPYICLSRNWDAAKFGGFGVWLDDQIYAAAMAACFDAEAARETLAAALDGATPEGNLACLVTANDAWVDRSQIPLAAFFTWSIAERCGARSLLQLAWPALQRNHDWWWRVRDPTGSGLASYGTSDVGTGLYKGTHFGARNESSMDNAPFHDEAEYDARTRTLDLFDVGLNSLLALDAEVLALIAAQLGHDAEAERLGARARATRALIRTELWDEGRGLFANRKRAGRFVRSVGPTSFYPLICGAASPAQAARLVAHLNDAATFGGAVRLPSVSRDDPAFADNTYWRGRVWPPMNFLVWHGLRRYGFDQDATALAEASMALFRQSWERERLCPENYNATTGEALDQPDTDSFYTWGALMPLMGVGEITDVTPWNGWEVRNAGQPLRLGPLESPAGPVSVTVEAGRLALTHGQRVLLATDFVGRISQLRLPPGAARVELPPGEGSVWFPSMAAGDVHLCQIDGAAASWAADGQGIVVQLPACERRRRLVVT